MYKALALDLDGTTLVGEDLPPANAAALRRAAQAGMHVIVATARWIQMAERVAREVGVDGPAIACSGAQVRVLSSGQDVFDLRLPTAFTNELYELCNSQRCIATVTVGEDVFLKLDGEPDASLMSDEMTWVPQLALQSENLPRIAAIQGSKICEIIKQELQPKYADTVNVFDSIGPTGKLILTITAKGADKGSALQAACSHLSIQPEEVVAFGDAENDLAMFRAAGLGVAMGQAEDDLKAAADYVTLPNDQDGVAVAVNRLLDTGQLP